MSDAIRLIWLVTAWLVSSAAISTLPAGHVTVLIHQNDASARADEDTTLGQYYTVQYSLPEGLTAQQVDRAILEIYVEVRSKTRDGYVNEAPVIEVYAPTQAVVDVVGIEDLDAETRGHRPVARGDARHVRIDVTKIVRAHLGGSLDNNGLVIGSFSGMREGDFALVGGRLPEGAVGRLNIYTHSQTN